MTLRQRGRRALLAAAATVVFTSVLFACGTASGTHADTATRNRAALAGAPGQPVNASPAAQVVKVFGADAKPLAGVPKDNPRKGLVYRGLTAAKTGPCVGGFQLGETKTGETKNARCTHGPDAPPANVSVKEVATPVAATTAASTAATVGLPVCEGDGTTGRRVEVLYVHGATSQYDKYLETFRVRAEQVDDIYYQSAQETGGIRHVRYVTETVGGVCRPVVRDVPIADSALADFDTARQAVSNLGYNHGDRKYLMFVDTNVYCGIGEFLGDTTKSDANRSNGGGYARVDNGCWDYPDVAAHELGHNLGAVNDDTPNSSHNGHCTDEYDVMCYKDSDATVLRTACPDAAHDLRLDCNHDDYYDTNPSPGSYLAKEWNVADNLFLIKGAGDNPSVSPSASATPTPTSSAATTTTVVGAQSSRCLDINLDDVTNGLQAQIWDCNGGQNQAWTYTASKTLLLHSNKCLQANATSAGAAVVIWDCDGGTNQQWTFNTEGTLTGVQSGLCLDASGQGTDNGTKLQLWDCNGQTNQQWSRV